MLRKFISESKEKTMSDTYKYKVGSCPKSHHFMEYYEYEDENGLHHGFECQSCGEFQTG